VLLFVFFIFYYSQSYIIQWKPVVINHICKRPMTDGELLFLVKIKIAVYGLLQAALDFSKYVIVGCNSRNMKTRLLCYDKRKRRLYQF
jgi:hypothetical protein